MFVLDQFNILLLILLNESLLQVEDGMLVEDGRGMMRGNGRSWAKLPLVPVGIPTGTKGGFRYRVIYPVSKPDPIGLTLGAPVEKPVPKLVSNRC